MLNVPQRRNFPTNGTAVGVFKTYSFSLIEAMDHDKAFWSEHKSGLTQRLKSAES